MKRKHLCMIAVMTLLACLGMTSCKHVYYQVYDVNTDGLKQEDNSLVYENSDLKMMYNLWGDNGKVGFILQNKTDKDLFVDMDQTFFILNGEAKDYFKNRRYTTTSSDLVSSSVLLGQSFLPTTGYWPSRYYVPTVTSIAKQQKGYSYGTSVKEKKIICIPARAYKVISEYKVSPALVKTCNRKQDFPRGTANVASYTADNSPVKFRNRIAYSFDADCKSLQHIENSFYVNNVTNYAKKVAVQKVNEKLDCYDLLKQKREYFKIGGPNKFYKTYYTKGARSKMYEY